MFFSLLLLLSLFCFFFLRLLTGGIIHERESSAYYKPFFRYKYSISYDKNGLPQTYDVIKGVFPRLERAALRFFSSIRPHRRDQA